MQPIRLYWAPRLWAPHYGGWAWLFSFARYSLRTRIVEKLINLIISKLLSCLNER